MKQLSIILSILTILLISYISVRNYAEKRDLPKEIATFKSIDEKSTYKLTYSENGDLTFFNVVKKSSQPSITYVDYYGSTEVISYEWLADGAISIQTKDSAIRITIPEFKISAIEP